MKSLFKLAAVFAVVCFLGVANANVESRTIPRIVYQKTIDISGLRDLVYSGKIVGNTNQYVMVGPTTQQASVGTGTDFFALSIDKRTGNVDTSFGNNGIVTIDFDNVNGTSRTDVATEVLILDKPARIAVLGESVTSKTGAVNLTFSIAMLNAANGNLVSNFGNGGKALYDIEKGNNDEIFFGDVDEVNNDMIVGGFANPGAQVGAGPAFNCALLKIDQYGNRVKTFGQNGQVIIDFNGWDDRCRSGIALKNGRGALEGYAVGGRTKPSPLNVSLATDDQNNWRFSTSVVDAEGNFVSSYTDKINGFGRIAVNMNNGSYDAIRSSVGSNDKIYTVGNWGGWDNGVSGNKGVALTRWSPRDGDVDTSFLGVVRPKQLQSFDIYSIDRVGSFLYVSGSVKATAAASSLPQAIVMRFFASNGNIDDRFGDFGIYKMPLPAGYVGSNFRSVQKDSNGYLMLSGEAIKMPATTNDFDSYYARLQI